MGPSSSTAASLPFPSLTSDTLSSSSACTANLSTLEPTVDDEDVPGRQLRPLFIARGNLLEKVGTAIGPTGRYTGRCAFFMAFFTRLINKGTTFVIHIENPLESISPQTQDGVDSLVRIWFHAQGTLLAGCGAV